VNFRPEKSAETGVRFSIELKCIRVAMSLTRPPTAQKKKEFAKKEKNKVKEKIQKIRNGTAAAT